MGTVKQLLQLDDRPLLQHVLDNVRASEVREIVLVLGSSAEAISREIDAQNVRVVLNESYLHGMGTSLKKGLSALDPEAEAALIVLADQPFVRPTTINQLIAEHRRSTAQIVIPTYRGFRGNPVLLDRSVFPEVMALGGDIGCRAIFGDHPQGILKRRCNPRTIGPSDRASELNRNLRIQVNLGSFVGCPTYPLALR
jgi:molybdenum cofactor cytidylyltransferase